MNTNPASEENRPAYVAPRITSYTENEVAETLGPVLLSGNGYDLGTTAGSDSPTANSSGGRPRR